MARKTFSIDGDMFGDYLAKLDKLGGTDAMKRGVTDALKDAKDHVTPQIEKAVQKNNLPARGKYSHGGTAKSIDKDKNVLWQGLIGEVKVGFKFKESGLKSIFLMYGTPRMAPARGLKNAIYGSKTAKEVQEIEEKAFNKAISNVMGGK